LTPKAMEHSLRAVRFLALASVTVSLTLLACGPKKPAEDASDEADPAAEDADSSDDTDAEEEEEADEEEGAAGLPTECIPKDDVCIPPPKWVQRLCRGSYPGVALVMFRGGSPWKRAYVRVKARAVNATAGGVSGEGYLVPGEEVIVVRSRKQPKDGMQVSGAGGYDVLRWDGTCATLSDEEVGLQPYGQLEAAKVTFRFLDESIAKALRKDDTITEAYRQRKKHCRGATMGVVSKECEKWDKKLPATIVEKVRAGIELPTPDKLP
jgi:hypothetical protein